MIKQFVVTPAMGKRLIGKGLAAHPVIKEVLAQGTLVIVAGTTNGYVAEEILAGLGVGDDFSRKGFRRGMVTPPGFDASSIEAKLEGDVVIVKGKWQPGKTIFDVADSLGPGDVILKGANAVNLPARQAAVYIEHPQVGTAGAALPAVVGRRTKLIVPVGVAKRVDADIADLALLLNDPSAEGPRMLALPGLVFTELDAIELLSGAAAMLVAAGGIYGAEGAVWVGIKGESACIDAAAGLIESVACEPACEA